MRVPALTVSALALVFAACNAQPATDAELAELEAAEAASTVDDGPEADEPSDEPVAAASEGDDEPTDIDRNVVDHETGEDKPEDEIAVEDVRDPSATPQPESFTLTANGREGAALRLGTSTTVTAPQVQLRVGTARPVAPQIRPQMQPASNQLQLDLTPTGAVDR